MCQQLIGDIKHVKKYGNFTSVLSWLFLGLHILAQHSSLYNKYMLFARQEVCIEKNCARVLDNTALGSTQDRLRAQFSPIQTDPGW